MNAFAPILLVLLASVPAVAEVPSKPAWKWTFEERIAKRLDPDAIRERTNANERDLVDFRASVGVAPMPVRFVIEGRRDPALLMPFELFGSILEGLDDQPGSGARRVYRRPIIESGWEEETFWRILRDATAEMMKTQRERLALKDGDGYALNVKECGSRAEALQVVREQLGAERFDRFLYEKVAPNVGIGSDFPLANEEWRLRWVEGGCRRSASHS